MARKVVLAVEDSSSDELLIREAFREANPLAELVFAKDGVEALAVLHRKDPYSAIPHADLILVDLNLPKLDGKAVVESARRIDEYRLTPILMFSSSNSESEITKCYELGANCYLCKPVDLAEFFGLIATVNTFWLNSAQLPSIAYQERMNDWNLFNC